MDIAEAIKQLGQSMGLPLQLDQNRACRLIFDGRIEVEFEVDQNRVGKRWRVTIKRNGSTVFRSMRTTQAPSGSFEVRRLLAGGAGSRIVATAKALSSGETCRTAITF